MIEAVRVWDALIAANRAGAVLKKDMKPGSMAVFCGLCPQLGINMSPGHDQRAGCLR